MTLGVGIKRVSSGLYQCESTAAVTFRCEAVVEVAEPLETPLGTQGSTESRLKRSELDDVGELICIEARKSLCPAFLPSPLLVSEAVHYSGGQLFEDRI